MEQQIQVPTHGDRLFPTWIGFRSRYRATVVDRYRLAPLSLAPARLPTCPDCGSDPDDRRLLARCPNPHNGYISANGGSGRQQQCTMSSRISRPLSLPRLAVLDHTRLFDSSIGGGRFKSTPCSLRRRESWLFLMGRPSTSSR